MEGLVLPMAVELLMVSPFPLPVGLTPVARVDGGRVGGLGGGGDIEDL